MSAAPIDIAYDPERIVHLVVDPMTGGDRIDAAVSILERVRSALEASDDDYLGSRADAREMHDWRRPDGTMLSIVPQVVGEGIQITIRVWLDGDVVTASMRGIGDPSGDAGGPPAALWCMEIGPRALMTMARQALEWMDACIDDATRPSRPDSSAVDAVLRGAAWLALDELGGDHRFSVDVIAPTPWIGASMRIAPYRESILHHEATQEILTPLDGLVPCLSMLVGDGNISLGVHGPDIDPGDVDPLSRMRDVLAYRDFIRRIAKRPR